MVSRVDNMGIVGSESGLLSGQGAVVDRCNIICLWLDVSGMLCLSRTVAPRVCLFAWVGQSVCFNLSVCL